MKIDRGRLVYCNMADVIKLIGNLLYSQRFYTPKVVDGRFEEIDPKDLKQGDVIYFQPMIKMIGWQRVYGKLAVVHEVSPKGAVYLGNLHMTQDQIRMLNDQHVSGKF